MLVLDVKMMVRVKVRVELRQAEFNGVDSGVVIRSMFYMRVNLI